MAALPRSEKLRFMEITSRRQRVVVISKFRAWLSHYDVTERKTRRCGGATCLLCQMGLASCYRYVAMVVDQNGTHKLLELRERHLGLLEVIRNDPKGEVGCILNVRKAGDAINSPVEVTCSDRQNVIEQDIQKLVDVLGLPAKFISGDVIPEDPKVIDQLEEVQNRLAAQFNVN